MEILCTRPHCPRPKNIMPDLDDRDKLGSIEQAYCTACRMPLILGGRYIPAKFLGRGGFGAAFLAFDRFHPRLKKCVVKQFQPSPGLGTAAVEKAQLLFIQEAEVLADLGRENPGVPELYASFPLNVANPLTEKKDRFFYLVQEYIEGETLEKKLETENAPLPESEVRSILVDLLGILKNIHADGVIHRDIKPGNIIGGHNGKIYLIDFGSVKQVASIEGASTRMFTPGYAPPEQESGGVVSPSSDLYALAATCAHLLTNRPPEDLCDPTTKIWTWHPPAPGVSDDLARVLNTMLQPAPRDRFQSAAEVLSRLAPVTPHVVAAPVAPPPARPAPMTPSPLAPPPAPPRGKIPLAKVITSAGLVGFMGTILAIVVHSLSPAVAALLAPLITGTIVFFLYRGSIDRKDLLGFIAILTLLIAAFPKLRGVIALPDILILALFMAAGSIVVTALFRLIHSLVSRVV